MTCTPIGSRLSPRSIGTTAAGSPVLGGRRGPDEAGAAVGRLLAVDVDVDP
jgi:hypothetical protein